MDLVNFDVCINEDLTLTIQTDRDSAERAYRDQAYLQEITNQELNKLNMETANDINSLIQTDSSGSKENKNENDSEQLSHCEERSASFWTPNDTHLLLTVYKEKEEDLKKGGMRQGQFWEIIAKEISRVNPNIRKTAIQCSNKIGGLKRTYKNMKDHNNKSGNNRKTWSFYGEMDEIFGNRAWVSPKSLASEVDSDEFLPPSTSSSSSTTMTKSCKRKRDVLLGELVSETKVHYKEKKLREEKKLDMFDKFRKEKIKMHNEKISMQEKMLDMMTKLYSVKKE